MIRPHIATTKAIRHAEMDAARSKTRTRRLALSTPTTSSAFASASRAVCCNSAAEGSTAGIGKLKAFTSQSDV